MGFRSTNSMPRLESSGLKMTSATRNGISVLSGPSQLRVVRADLDAKMGRVDQSELPF